MKKITLLLAFCSIYVIAKAYPQTLPIDYQQFFATSAMGTDPSLEKGIYTSSTATIMPNQWNRSGKLTAGEGAGVSPIVENSTLNYSTYVDNNIGKAINLDPNIQADPNVSGSTFRTTIYSLTSSSTDYTGKAFYAGMLVNFTTVTSTSGTDFFGFDSNYTGNAQRGRIFVKASVNSGYYNMGIGFSSTSDVSAWSGDLTLGTTYFIVAKIIPASSGSETIALYINPAIGATEAESAVNNTGSYTAALKSIKGLIIRQRPGMGGKIAGIRFGDNWSDVVKASPSSLIQLSSPSVGTPTDATANGFTAHWSPVNHATGYDVKIYLGTNLVGTTNASGQATSIAAISGLMSGMTYTYQVIAKGDAVTYSDSNPSASSSEIKTLDPYATDAIHTDFNDGTWETIAGSIPTSGSYPTYSVNGFDLTAATLCVGSIVGIKGESHVNRIAIDKLTNNGNVALPTVNALKQIEIHATAGTAGNGFQLKEFNPSTNSWSAIGSTFVYNANSKAAGVDSIYIISLERTSPTKFRIENPTNGAIYIWQIITHNTNPVLLSKPVVLDASNVTTSGATANWTPVENATGYKIYVYQGTTLIAGAPFSVNGQTINSFDIINLAASTTYSYKVQAIGDGDINYSDSFVSSAIEFSTVITGTDNLKNNPNITVVNKKIVCTETGNIHIYNMQGSLIESARNVKTIQTNLPTGIYIVKFSNQNGETKIQKISIQ